MLPQETIFSLNITKLSVKSTFYYYMKLKLIEKYSEGQYPLEELREKGLTSVQGRSKATTQLLNYLENKQCMHK